MLYFWLVLCLKLHPLQTFSQRLQLQMNSHGSQSQVIFNLYPKLEILICASSAGLFCAHLLYITLRRPKLARMREVMCVSSCEGSRAALVAIPTRSPLIPMRTELGRLPASGPALHTTTITSSATTQFLYVSCGMYASQDQVPAKLYADAMSCV